MIVRLFWAAVLALTLSFPLRAQSVDPILRVTQQLAFDPMSVERETSAWLRSPSPASLEIGIAWWANAQAHFRLGDLQRAEQSNQRARQVARGISNMRLLAYTDILSALIARAKGDYGLTLRLLQRAQRQFVAVGDRRGHGVALQTMAATYNDVREWETSLGLLHQAAAIYDGDALFRLVNANNEGVAREGLNDLAGAFRSFRRTRDVARQIGLAPIVEAATLNLVNGLILGNRLSEAEGELRRFKDDAGNRVRNPAQLGQIEARLAFRRGRLSDAAELWFRSSQSQGPAANQYATLMLGYNIAKAIGDEAAALERLERAEAITVEETRTVARNRAALLAAQFQLSAQEARVAQIRARALREELVYQRRLTWVLLIAAVTFGIGLVAYLRNVMRAQARAEADGRRLAETNQALSRALAAKSEFLAATSHELRTPLNGILGMTQVLSVDPTLTPQQRDRLTVISDAGRTMRTLVDDILDTAKVEQGALTIMPRPTDPAALAEHVVKLFTASAAAADLALQLHLEDAFATQPRPTLLLDPERITQLLFNLVGNAIKFTEAGQVDVTLSRRGESLRIAVADTGIGIAPELHAAIFDRFRQVDATRRRAHGGSGLGLAITRGLVEAMGGSIAVDSAPGRGSCFTIELPWKEAVAPMTTVPPPPSPDAAVSFSSDPMRAALLHAALRRCAEDAERAESAAALIERYADRAAFVLIDASDWPALSASVGRGAAKWDVLCIEPNAGKADPSRRVEPLLVPAAASVASCVLSRGAVAQHWSRIRGDPSISDLSGSHRQGTGRSSTNRASSIGAGVRQG